MVEAVNQVPDSVTSDSDWKGPHRVGGMAAMIAGVLFRRNIAAEIGLFSGQASPVTVSSWFELLQNNRLLGLTYLNIFDIVNYLLLSLMVLALFAALNRTHKCHMAIAALLGLLGLGLEHGFCLTASCRPRVFSPHLHARWRIVLDDLAHHGGLEALPTRGGRLTRTWKFGNPPIFFHLPLPPWV